MEESVADHTQEARQNPSLRKQTTEHMTGALSPLFLPGVLHPPPHIQRCRAGSPPAVIGETGLAQPRRRSEEARKESRRAGRWRRTGGERGRRAAVRNEQPKICSGCTVNSSSDCSGVTAPAEVGTFESEEDGEGESATDGGTERQRHGHRWVGVMGRKELSHINTQHGGVQQQQAVHGDVVSELQSHHPVLLQPAKEVCLCGPAAVQECDPPLGSITHTYRHSCDWSNFPPPPPPPPLEDDLPAPPPEYQPSSYEAASPEFPAPPPAVEDLSLPAPPMTSPPRRPYRLPSTPTPPPPPPPPPLFASGIPSAAGNPQRLVEKQTSFDQQLDTLTDLLSEMETRGPFNPKMGDRPPPAPWAEELKARTNRHANNHNSGPNSSQPLSKAPAVAPKAAFGGRTATSSTSLAQKLNQNLNQNAVPVAPKSSPASSSFPPPPAAPPAAPAPPKTTAPAPAFNHIKSSPFAGQVTANQNPPAAPAPPPQPKMMASPSSSSFNQSMKSPPPPPQPKMMASPSSSFNQPMKSPTPPQPKMMASPSSSFNQPMKSPPPPQPKMMAPHPPAQWLSQVEASL
ncbi:hypothetical protein F7725_017942 [Dissostichus mawsoni]|uniref:Uncharacterized protein n=1 Tax=Dissostichus mawsoni TaxID=36200 RepID=A0A7J5XQ32_DISMA|nr:hypothetical protein F7725_017942 [Dissostichus mawsoni]